MLRVRLGWNKNATKDATDMRGRGGSASLFKGVLGDENAKTQHGPRLSGARRCDSAGNLRESVWKGVD